MLFEVLCFLINSSILHVNSPESCLSGTLNLLLKAPSLDKTQLSSCRPITLSNLFGKIVDTRILNRHSNIFQSSAMQFGFKKNHSTNHCSFVIKEVMSYYTFCIFKSLAKTPELLCW